RRRGALRGGLPEGLGGPDREARGQHLHERTLTRLAQAEVRGGAGARGGRLHGTEGIARGARRAARRVLRGRAASVRGEGGHGVRSPDAPRPLTPPAAVAERAVS